MHLRTEFHADCEFFSKRPLNGGSFKSRIFNEISVNLIDGCIFIGVCFFEGVRGCSFRIESLWNVIFCESRRSVFALILSCCGVVVRINTSVFVIYRFLSLAASRTRSVNRGLVVSVALPLSVTDGIWLWLALSVVVEVPSAVLTRGVGWVLVGTACSS